ncbi:uncharacterized protein VSU04_011160 [Chlamydotis macqueenii]
MSPLPSPRRNYATRPVDATGARSQRSVTVAAGASALWRGCGGRPPISDRGGSAFLPAGRGVLPPLRPPEATVRQRAAVGGKRGGLGGLLPLSTRSATPAVPPGAALTADMACLSLEWSSPVYPRAAEWKQI